jgi:heme oxygenase (mycobilin-producing)
LTKGAPRGAPFVVSATIFGVSIVKINAITVPRERFDDFAQRFATRAGKVSSAEGFESFQLLRPNDEREVCLVITQWRSEEDFVAWMKGPDFAAGHAQHRTGGPVGTGSEVWSFDVLETEAPASA